MDLADRVCGIVWVFGRGRSIVKPDQIIGVVVVYLQT